MLYSNDAFAHRSMCGAVRMIFSRGRNRYCLFDDAQYDYLQGGAVVLGHFSNQMRTFFLLTLLTVLLIYGGRALGGEQGMVLAFIFAVVLNVGSYWFSDRIAISMTRSRPVTEE